MDDVLVTILTANLHRAERRRQSILKQAFAGRLVPQDPTDESASVLLETI
jgi:type I restriction enzyme S subunit